MRLDELLEQYLNTLDEYQKGQQQLALHLTPGFMSLAKANFNNTSRTRYGQDYYDERMQASRMINVGEEDLHVIFEIAREEANLTPSPTSPSPKSENITPPSSEEKNEASAASSGESEEASNDADSNHAATSNKPTEANDSSSGNSKSSTDPLRWFGILVPPALRSSQSAFASAVEGPVLQLASVVKDLRRLENDIARLRKQIRKL